MVGLATRLSEALRGHAGVRLAVLFGSQARGDAGAASDVDIAVRAPGLDLLSIRADLERALGLTVDVVDLDRVTFSLLDEIVRDGFVVYEGRPGAAATFWSHSLTSLATDRATFDQMAAASLRAMASGDAW